MPARPVLHGDDGATLKATTVLAMLHWLGVKPVLVIAGLVIAYIIAGHHVDSAGDGPLKRSVPTARPTFDR